MRKTRAMVILGGPSGERGISINSARSIVDHLRSTAVRVESLVYVDTNLQKYELDHGQLYSNTPLDFDHKKRAVFRKLTGKEFTAMSRNHDIIIPLIHGEYGEDGSLQAELEDTGVPFVGSGAAAALTAYDKWNCHRALVAAGIDTIPTISLDATKEQFEDIDDFGQDAHAWSGGPIVVKPARGGSSLGITVIRGDKDTPPVDQLRELCSRTAPGGRQLLAQPMMSGREVSLVVLEGPDGPVALPPLHIERGQSQFPSDIFSYREKYMPSEHIRFHCPIDEDDATVNHLRELAERVFGVLELRDWARIDCWITNDRRVLISDVNPISGAEQNSIFFIAGAEIGLTHEDVVQLAIQSCLRRSGQSLAIRRPDGIPGKSERAPLRVLFGGSSSERQVSVLSGVNIWLKLRHSAVLRPEPYFFTSDHSVIPLSYAAALRHSVEEIEEYAVRSERVRDLAESLGTKIRARLGFELEPIPNACGDRMTLEQFLLSDEPVFLGLHGGIGEDGTLQGMLTEWGIRHNGPPADVCRLCMDKARTAATVANANIPGVRNGRVTVILASVLAEREPEGLWAELTEGLSSEIIVLKPATDGCSTGVVVVSDAIELATYAQAVRSRAKALTGRLFAQHDDEDRIDMPVACERFMAEPYIETDSLELTNCESEPIRWGAQNETGWIEITAGVIEVEGELECLTPSLTVASSGVLSVAEKFMGGTGVNFTPPPPPPEGKVKPEAVKVARDALLQVAKVLGIRGYSRIDAFMHRESGEIIVIEANALPALTPSTVLFQQATARESPLLPLDLLEVLAPRGQVCRDPYRDASEEAGGG